MASHAMDSQATTNQGRSGLAFGLRALVAMMLASTLLAGCSGTMEKQATATGLPGASDTQALADRTHRFVADAPKADLAIGGNDFHADTFPCISRPADCRIRDLRTPWETRRYLMPDGTLSAPPGPGKPQ